MSVSDKLKLWVALLLFWNSSLLVILIILTLANRPPEVGLAEIAKICADQAQSALTQGVKP
jgi:hypothetical protein